MLASARQFGGGVAREKKVSQCELGFLTHATKKRALICVA